MTSRGGQEGFTFIEIIVASLIMMLIVAAVIQYHASSGASKGQEYYLKAVQLAHSELDRLRALYELDSGCSEFESAETPSGDLFLFRFTGPTSIDLPNPVFHVYYQDHGYSNELFRSLGNNKSVKGYRDCYETAYNGFVDTDDVDRKTFAYYTDDGNRVTDSNPSGGEADASIVVIDDMGSPGNPEDDLLGNIGWWVEDVALSGVTHVKKVTFALQFWYPGQDWERYDPEVIVLKTTLAKP